VISTMMMILFVYLGVIKGGGVPLFMIAMILNGISQTFFSMALTTIFSDSKISV